MKPRHPREQALLVANTLITLLSPACEQIGLAGSLRRGSPTVGDIELLCIPKLVPDRDPRDFFTTTTRNLLDDTLQPLIHSGLLTKRLSVKGTPIYGPLNKLLLHVPSQIPIDLFTTSQACWFNSLVCRTGPAESNQHIATQALKQGYRWNPYGPGFTHLQTGKVTPMHSEPEVFQFVGLPVPPWIHPTAP